MTWWPRGITRITHLGLARFPHADQGIGCAKAKNEAVWVKLCTGVPLLDARVGNLRPSNSIDK